jgi:hypothetical protein
MRIFEADIISIPKTAQPCENLGTDKQCIIRKNDPNLEHAV